MDILRYYHTLDNGEELTLSMGFTGKTGNSTQDKMMFYARCEYMYDAMQQAIKEHKARFLSMPNVEFRDAKITLTEK